MIGTIFEFNGENVEVRLDFNKVYFRTVSSNNMLAPLSALELNREGVLKEFPDLKDNPDWKKIALERFKEKIMSYNTEEEGMNYIIEDLRKFGYKPIYKQKAGWRPEKII